MNFDTARSCKLIEATNPNANGGKYNISVHVSAYPLCHIDLCIYPTPIHPCTNLFTVSTCPFAHPIRLSVYQSIYLQYPSLYPSVYLLVDMFYVFPLHLSTYLPSYLRIFCPSDLYFFHRSIYLPTSLNSHAFMFRAAAGKAHLVSHFCTDSLIGWDFLGAELKKVYFAHIRDKLRFELELACFATTFVLKVEKRCRVGTLASWQGQNLARSAVWQTCFGSGLKSLGLFRHLFFLYVLSLCFFCLKCSSLHMYLFVFLSFCFPFFLSIFLPLHFFLAALSFNLRFVPPSPC